ncbi:hypothetical protein CLAIMM_00538 isoform 2 [Cladophialophora immunda]|nr:hypothetical protein CLAIMM_00538 isoform 2 [Cladophialophora immunda]
MSGHNSPLFLHSSPPPHLARSPDDEVQILVQRARGVEALGSAFDSFLVSYNHAFFDVFDRQVELIKSRSQAFEDGHVTVFDKTLLILTHNGNDLDNPAAIKYYCREYLNIDIDIRGAGQELTSKLQQSVQVSGALQEELSSGKSSTVKKEAGQKRARLLPVDPNLRKDMEPRLAVLWSVYETARAEYLAVVDKDDNEKAAKRAKFLRDTAENILLYLENRNADPLMIAELEGTFSHAKNTAVCLTGGKKRKFDPSEMEKVKGTPRGPSLPYMKEKYRRSGGIDAGAYNQHQHHQPDISSGHAGEVTSSYGWGGADLPSGHGHPHRAQYSDTYPYQDRDSRHLGYTVAPGRDRRRSDDKDEKEYYVSASGPHNAAVSRGRQDRGPNGSRTRDLSDGRLSPVSSDYQDAPDRREEREKSPSPNSPPRSASPTGDSRRRRRRVMQDRSRRRSRSRAHHEPGHDRGYSRATDDRWYSHEQDRELDRHRGAGDRSRAGASGGGRPRHPLRGRGHSSVPYGYGGHRLLDSYVPSRDPGPSPGPGRRGS